MDDFDYSVQISERDWDLFFQECEECDLLPPAVAGPDDSGTSDADDGASSRSRPAEEGDPPEHDWSIDEPPERTGLPVERYLSACRHPGPEDLLSCSEEDTHLESINVFFERLRSIEGGGGGSFLAEAKPKETWQEVCDLEEPAKELGNQPQLSQAKSQSDSSALSFSPTAKEDKVGGAISTGRGEKDRDRAGKSIELESEEDDVLGLAKPAVELFIREEDWAVNEEWVQEKEGDLTKDELLKAAPSCSTSSNDEFGLSRKPTVEELQPSGLKDMNGTEPRAGEGTMTSQNQAFLKEATSLDGHQVELQTDPEAVLCVDTAAGAENHTVKSENEQKEHMFVSAGVGRDSASSPSVKKKRKRARGSGAPLVAGQASEGLRGRTESEKQVEMFEQGAAGQGEVVSWHDSRACVDKAGSKRKSVSAHQMTQSFGTVPRSSELLSKGRSVKEYGAESNTAGHNRDFEEPVTRPKENIPNSTNQQQYGPGHDFRNHSQQICTPAGNAEMHNLTACEQPDNSHECLQAGGVMIQHDPVSPQCSGLSGPESRNGSEQFTLTEPDRFNIAEESSPDQKKMLQNKPTLQMNSPEDGKAVCKLSNVLLETSSSAEAPQCNQPFVRGMSGSQDSRNQNIPEHEQEVTHGQSLPTFSQEKNMNIIRSTEISPPKELKQMHNITDLPEPTRISLSLNNIGGHGPSWCDEFYPVDVQCPNSDEEENPPEYQEVEEFNNVPINVSNETTSQCQAKTEIGNIGPKTSCAASENHKPSVVISDKALPFQTPKLIDTQIPVQSDLVPAPAPAPPGTYNAANGLSINLTKSSVASDGNGSSVKSIALPDSNSDKASKADDWLQEKGENLPRTNTVECVKSPQQASIDISAVNEVEAVLGPELQNKQSVDKPVLHTLEAKVNSSAECEPSLPLESTASAKPLETNEPNKPLDTKRPVHSMSAFWKEMEKLTINDILYLRSSSNAPRVLSRDSAPTDTSDAGDSGNSSHLENSRLDRSCVDMSTIPEFEEVRSLSHSASVKSSLDPRKAKKPGQRSLGSCNSRGVLWESELHPAGPGTDDGTHETPPLYPGDTITPPFLSDKAHQGLRRMCKNVSVQNLRALEAEPRVTSASLVTTTTTTTEEEVLRESSGTFQRPKEKCTSVPLESRSARKSSVESSLPGDGATTGGYGMSFREIVGYFFGASEAGVGQADTSHTEVPAGDGGSVPETYDHFFSEFETGNFFFPLIRGTGGEQNESVAVVSCSSSSDRNLQFPEAYDYFFPDSSSSDSDDKEDSDDDQGPIRVVTRFDKGAGESPADTAEAPDMYEHFFASSDWGESLFWRNPLSLRRMRFTGTTGSNEGPASRVLVTAVQMGRSVISTIFTDSAGYFHGAVSPQRPLYCLEEQIFRELEEQQRRYTDLQTAVAVPMTTDTPLLPLRQSDMCLICISFASWVLKTANPHDSDTWKAALLANISALSAIRYLRRYVRDAGKEA